MMAPQSTPNANGQEKLPRYINHDGYLVAGGFPVEGFNSGLKYKAQDDDLFIVTYPKVKFIVDIVKDYISFNPHLNIMQLFYHSTVRHDMDTAHSLPNSEQWHTTPT